VTRGFSNYDITVTQYGEQHVYVYVVPFEWSGDCSQAVPVSSGNGGTFGKLLDLGEDPNPPPALQPSTVSLSGLVLTGEVRVGSTVSRTYLVDPLDARIWTEWHVDGVAVSKGPSSYTVKPGDVGLPLVVKVQAKITIANSDGTTTIKDVWRQTAPVVIQPVAAPPAPTTVTLSGLVLTGEARVGSTVSRSYVVDPLDASIWTEWHVDGVKVREGPSSYMIPADPGLVGKSLTVKVRALIRVPDGAGGSKKVEQWRHTTVIIQPATP
jgi:hypothetical protein